MKRIIITGGNGKLAQEIIKQNKNFEIVAPDKQVLDISNFDSIKHYVDQICPDIIIHAAALTTPLNLHEENISLSIQLNIIGSAYITQIAAERNIKLIYISTDYIYPFNTKRALENQPVLPFNNYGWSKLGGECAVKLYSNSLILRLSFSEKPFPHEGAYRNVIKNHLYIDEAANLILKMINQTGIINLGSQQTHTLYDFAKKTRPNIKALYCEKPTVPKEISLNVNKMNEVLIQENKSLDIAILMPCWKGIRLLEVSIPSLLKATKSNSEIIVILNEADQESITFLDALNVKHIPLKENYGPAAVDVAIPYIKEKNFKYVANVNSDMIFSEGWDIELISLLKENEPCSVSCTLVEPLRGICTLYENLGDFFKKGNHETFNNLCKSRHYTTTIETSYSHPIMCKTSDFINVNGYSDGMKNIWIELKGRGLDDDFAFRLFTLYNGNFNFLRSDKAFVYHGISINSSQLTHSQTELSKRSHEYFQKTREMTIEEFQKLINHEKFKLKNKLFRVYLKVTSKLTAYLQHIRR